MNNSNQVRDVSKEIFSLKMPHLKKTVKPNQSQTVINIVWTIRIAFLGRGDGRNILVFFTILGLEEDRRQSTLQDEKSVFLQVRAPYVSTPRN